MSMLINAEVTIERRPTSNETETKKMMIMTTKSRKRCLILVNHLLQNLSQWFRKRQQNKLFRAN